MICFIFQTIVFKYLKQQIQYKQNSISVENEYEHNTTNSIFLN